MRVCVGVLETREPKSDSFVTSPIVVAPVYCNLISCCKILVVLPRILGRILVCLLSSTVERSVSLC